MKIPLGRRDDRVSRASFVRAGLGRLAEAPMGASRRAGPRTRAGKAGREGIVELRLARL